MSLLARVFSSFRRIIARIRDLASSRIARSLLGASFATFVHVFLFVGVGDFLEPWSLEVWFNVRGPQKAPEDVVLIAMDEDSYEELDLPMSEAWPRVIHAELLDRLAAAGAKVVAFDVVFAGPSDDPEGDKDLAEALHGLPTVIGIQMDNPTGTAPGTSNQLIYPYEPFQKQANIHLVSRACPSYPQAEFSGC
jgi:CHASE2 domain-containing sensor protein